MSTTLIINSQSALQTALHALRCGASPVLVVDVDAAAANLSPQQWGALLGALTLPGNAAMLRSLSFSNIAPDVSNLVVPHIGAVAQHLKNIHTLSICRASIALETAKALGKCIAGHPSLRRITLEHADLRDDGASSIIVNIFHTSSSSASPLESIDLGHNSIGADVCSQIVQRAEASDFPSLFRVTLRGNHGPGVVEFPERRRKGQPQRPPLPPLPQGENIKFLSTGMTEPRCPMPALEVMSKAVQDDLSQK